MLEISIIEIKDYHEIEVKFYPEVAAVFLLVICLRVFLSELDLGSLHSSYNMLHYSTTRFIKSKK